MGHVESYFIILTLFCFGIDQVMSMLGFSLVPIRAGNSYVMKIYTPYSFAIIVGILEHNFFISLDAYIPSKVYDKRFIMFTQRVIYSVDNIALPHCSEIKRYIVFECEDISCDAYVFMANIFCQWLVRNPVSHVF